MIQEIKDWLNVNEEYTRLRIEYPNRSKVAKWSIIIGIIFIAVVFLISFAAPRSDTPSVIESSRQTYKLLEPYQSIIYVLILLFVVFFISGFVFLWKSDKDSKIKKD